MDRRAAWLVVASLLAGCSSVVTSKDVPLGLLPREMPGISVDRGEIDASEAESIGRYGRYKDDIVDVLVSSAEAKGFVVEGESRPLRLTAELRYATTKDEPNLGIGVLSFFLPPLAFVPETRTEEVHVHYALRDARGRIVRQKKLDDVVAGYMKGWYVARINAWQTLKEKLAAAASRLAARLILQDIAQNADSLSAPGAAPPPTAAVEEPAAPAVDAEAAPAAAPAPVTEEEWWKKP